MENRNTILGISKKKVNFVHRIMLIAILHSSLIAPAQNMVVDYFNYKEPLHYSTSSAMEEEDKINPSNLLSQSVVRNAADESAIADTSERGFVYSVYADIQNGVIGVSDAHPLDDARDNLFKFYLKELPKDNTKIFLTYELFGVQDCNGVSRSINDRPSTGGYIVKNQLGWTSQREEINLKWLKTGENKVMFGIPKGANYQYQIKNLKLEFDRKTTNTIQSTLVVSSPTVNYIKDNQLYVKGFLRNSNFDTKVYVEDTPLTFINGEFEGFLKLTDAIKSRKFVMIKAFDSKGLLGQEIISIDNLAEADQLYIPEKNFDRVLTLAKANTNVALKADGASIAIKDNILIEDKEISITKLRNIDIAPMASGMINVTKGGYAYRFLPDGTKFDKPVELTIAYDEKLIPKGHNANEIKTFYFDTQRKAWVAIKRDTINKVDKSIVSLTNHFTDYINGIIQTPESPETAGFTPTMMNDIKAVDPSSEMTLISPPEVSQKGDANISYPIKIPAGRKGMQPQIAVQYSNEEGNGWLGQGWSLNIPSIAIDTRWGVPQFDGTNESEIYTLGGEQLMYPKMPSTFGGQPANDWMPNRHYDFSSTDPSTADRARIPDAVFTPRKQGSFVKIERLGNATTNYYWKVTTTDGTINWYGGKTTADVTAATANAVIKNAKGDIVHWGLYLTEDVFGNTIKYEYDNSVLSGQTGLNENLNGGKFFHIQKIKYNGYKDLESEYKYEVLFNSSSTIRDDASINQRLGVKQIEPYFLDNIIVNKIGASFPIRKYTLKAGYGLFNKGRLEAITELDKDGNEFYKHTFDYYDDVTNPGGNTKTYFATGETQTICNESAFTPCLDSDNDGVCNTNDTCPTVAGTAANNGCPLVKKCYQFEIAQVPGTYYVSFSTSEGILRLSGSYSINNPSDYLNLVEGFPAGINVIIRHESNMIKLEIMDNSTRVFNTINFGDNFEGAVSFQSLSPYNCNSTEPEQSQARNYFKEYLANVMLNNTFSLINGIGSNSSCLTPMKNPTFLIPGYIPSFDSNPSLLGSSTTESVSGGFYVGIGIGKNPFTKMTTFGMQFNFGNDKSESLTALIDINGDGLDDIVTKDGDLLFYKKHLVNRTYNTTTDEPIISHSFEDKKPISGINNFYLAFGRNSSKNFQITYGLKRIGGFIGLDKSKSTSETRTYFTDANGDGLMDIVRDGVVYFNRLDANNNPNFITDSQGTENLVIKAEAKTVDLPAIPEQEEIKIPAFDVVKVWEAPADGAIKIENNIVLTDPTKEAVATVEMRKERTPKCYEVSFSIPTIDANLYKYEFPYLNVSYIGIQGITNNCNTTASTRRISYFSVNNIVYNPISANLYQGHFNDNSNTITNLCNSVKNTNFENKFKNWLYQNPLNQFNIIENVVVNTAYYSTNPVISTNYNLNGSYFISTDIFQVKYNLDWAITDFENNPSFTSQYAFPIGLNSSSFSATVQIPTAISINGVLLQNNPYTLSDPVSFSQFQNQIQSQNPGSIVSLSNNIVTVRINNTTGAFNSITLTPTNGSAANTYNFSEISCNSIQRLSAGSGNKIATKQDDWKSYKPSKEELELGIKKWVADGSELSTPINDDFSLNFVVDATNNSLDKNIAGVYILNKEKDKSQWNDRKGVAITDKKTIVLLTGLLPNDIEKLYADAKDKNKQETIARRKQSQMDAQTWLAKNNKNQNISTNKTTSPSASNKIANTIPTDIVIDYPDNPSLVVQATNSITFKPGASVKATSGTFYNAKIVSSSSSTPPTTPPTTPLTTCNETASDLCLLYGTQLNTSNRNVTNTLTNNCSGQPLVVKKGDRIYFRVHSVAKGNPAVNWNPKVEYTTTGLASLTDANGHTPFSSSYSDGFVLTGKAPVKFPGNSGSAKVSWNDFQINNPTDKVSYQIIKRTFGTPSESTKDDALPQIGTDEIVYQHDCLPNQSNTVSTTNNVFSTNLNTISIGDQASAGYANLTQTYFYFKVTSASNVDWKNSVWKPKMEFETDTNIIPDRDNPTITEGTVKSKTTVYPVPDYDIYRLFPCSTSSFVKKDISAINGGAGLSIQPNLANIFTTGDTGLINFVVKRGTTLVGKRVFTISGSTATVNDVSAISITSGGSTASTIEIMYSIDDSESDGSTASLLNKLASTGNALATISYGSTTIPILKTEINFYQKTTPKMGSFYRQWGQFMYNPANVTGATPTGIAGTNLIKEQALQLTLNQNQVTELNNDLTAISTMNENTVTEAFAQNFQNSHQDYLNSSAFSIANPSRETNNGTLIDRWIGLHNENYASDLAYQAAKLEQSVITIEESFPVTEQAVLKTGAYAINKVSKGHSNNNFSAGINLTLGPDTGATASVGVNGSKSNGGANNTLSDYVDFNGDQYPDIVTTDKIQYTNKTGGLQNEIINNEDISTATSDSYGFGASGSFSQGNKAGGSKNGTGNEFHRFEGFRGNSGAGISGSFTKGNSVTQRVWTDINGDGLSDLLFTETNLVNGSPTEVTKVTLNAGTETPNTTVTNWGTIPLFKSKSQGISGGLGVNKWNGSVEAGVSLTTSWNSTTNTLVDINGDGLLDLLNTDSNLGVQLNLGNKFANNEIWTLNYNFNRESASVATSLNLGVTFALVWPLALATLKIPAVSINGTPLSTSTNKTKKSITDFDGDGYPDLVEEISPGNVVVYHSKIRRTDMLKTVTNPLGGKFTIDYKVQPKDYNNPNAKWAMSDLIIEDNYDKVNDGADMYKKHFVYEKGKYDRRERDFYGYKTVKVEDYTLVSGTPTLYRTSVSNYYNESYFLNGLLNDSYVIKGGDVTKKYSRTQNSYEIFKLNATNSGFTMNSSNSGIEPTTSQPLTFDVGGSEGRRSAGVLLTKTVTELYELDSSPQLTTEVRFNYDSKGRVIEFNNIGNSADANDNYTSTITYWEDTNLNIRNIINIPKSIKVKVGSTTVRERETEIDPINGNLKKISAKNGTEWAVTTMDDYDSYGNLKKITYPATSAAQAMTYDYTYDSVYHKYVIGIKDAFNYTSSAKYNSDFDKIEETTDLAGNIMTYQYDTFGRNTLILGPKERALGTDAYTLKFEYYPYHSLLPTNSDVPTTNFVPVAVTKHYDVQRPADPIETYTFIDGLARPIQVKKDISINNGSTVAPIYEAALSVSGKTLYDELGRAKQQFHPYWEPKADNKKFLLNETTNTNTQNNTLTEYDELDRPVKSTDPDNNISTMQYSISDVNGVKAIKTLSDVDQNGAQHIITETYKDVAGKVISTNNKGGTSGNIWTKFEYNAIGELMSYTDAANITTSYTYDMLGRKETIQSPDSGLTSYEYDIAGNLRYLQTANLAVQGKKIEYIYDKNRLTNIKYPDLAAGVANLANVDYTYGTTGNQTGRLIKQKDATGLQIFDYDNMGNIIKNDRTIIAPNLPKRQFKTYFTYDSWNRLQTMTYPDGETVTYNYDLGGNLNKMTGQLNSAAYEYIKRIDYDYFEQKTYMKYGNNTETAYNYSPALRRLSNLNVKTATGTNLFDNVYGYDKIGNVKSIVNSAGTVNATGGIIGGIMGGDYNHTYTYDNLNRLASASGSFTGSSTQIASGNDANSTYSLTMAYNNTHGILTKTQSHTKNGLSYAENTYANGYNYLNGTHKVSSIIDPNTHDEENFMYDLNGNLTHREFNYQSTGTGGESSYYWDESNRLRITTGATNTMQHYIYDASGERVLKASSDYSATYENGTLLNTGVLKMNSYTTYPSAFIVVNGDGIFSKHYYAGSQRIVSRLGDGSATTFNCADCATSKLAKPDKNQAEETALQQAQIADLQRYMEKAGKGKVTFTDYSPQLLADQERAIADEAIADNPTAKTSATAKTAGMPVIYPIYYYHPDHLGTSTFLTDANGNAYQFFLNLPYGETMAEQLGSNSYNTPYKFNGKELDADTGLYYYGARYYDPKTSIWLSVDPLAEKGPEYSPYCYTFNNPINLTDPDGRWPWPTWNSIKNRARNMVRDMAYAVVARTVSNARNYVVEKSRQILNAVTPSNPFTTAKSEKAQKGSGYGVNFTVEGGKEGAMKTPQGGRDVESVDMTIFMIFATDVFGPETFMPGAAPDGSNPFTQSNTSSASPTTAGTPSTSDNGMITMPLENNFASGTAGWNESQLHTQIKDTSVAPSQRGVIEKMNKLNRMRAEQKVKSENQELQKKIDYYKE